MTYLFVPFFRCGVRQNDICMAGVAGFWARPYLSPAGSGFPRRNHCPAVKRGVSSVGVPVRYRNRFGRPRVIEPVNGDFDYAPFLKKNMLRNFSLPGALCVTAGEYTPAEIFTLSDLVGSGHAVASSDRSSSARASRTNPSGSPRALE